MTNLLKGLKELFLMFFFGALWIFAGIELVLCMVLYTLPEIIYFKTITHKDGYMIKGQRMYQLDVDLEFKNQYEIVEGKLWKAIND